MAPTELKDYLNLDYPIALQHDDEGDWVATINELEGCMADGSTPDEAIQNLNSMKELWFKARLRTRRPIPLPSRAQEDYSGKWLQRVPKSLHRKIARAAEREGVSLNQFVTALLAEAVGEKAGKSSKEVALSIVAMQSVDPWLTGSRGDQGEWQTDARPALDRKRRDHGLRSLLRTAPATTAKPIGREFKSGDEENHEIWNTQPFEIAGR